MVKNLSSRSSVIFDHSEESNNSMILTWTVHPLVDRPLRSLLLIVILSTILAAVYLAYKSPFWVILSGMLLFVSLFGYFVPTSYELSEQGVQVKRGPNKYFLPWSRFRSYCFDSRGVLLSPFTEPNRLENFRGNYILIRQDRREEVREFLRKQFNEMEEVS